MTTDARHVSGLIYICAHCGVFAQAAIDSLDSGTTLMCRECHRPTVVDLSTPEARTRRYAADAALAQPARGEAGLPDDYAWALDRVQKMRDMAQTNASVYGPKLLKGHGYLDEVFRDAQDARALSIVPAAVASHPPEEEPR